MFCELRIVQLSFLLLSLVIYVRIIIKRCANQDRGGDWTMIDIGGDWTIIDIGEHTRKDKVAYQKISKAFICSGYLMGSCDGSCKNRFIHPKMKKPYQWRYQLKSANKDYYEQCDEDLSDGIESFYNDANCDQYRNAENTVVVFDSLEKPNEHSFYKNQPANFIRFSTPSAVKSDKNPFATEWKWYWKEKNYSWNVLMIADLTEKESIDIIESQYYRWLDTGEPEYLPFTAGKERQEYYLMFEEMKQKNLKYGTERPVRRRPAPIKDLIIPNHWPMDDEIVLIDVSSDVENKVRSQFSNTLPDKANQIISIKKVVNKRLYKIYLSKRDDMVKHSENLNEMQLWHGTSHDLIKTIYHQNFDFRLNSVGVYGKGSYFARDASYSHVYVKPDQDNNGFMFLADVLVGDYTEGNGKCLKPPLKDSEKFISYDSCVNVMENPYIYVIFDLIQAYPRYIVKYKYESFGPGN